MKENTHLVSVPSFFKGELSLMYLFLPKINYNTVFPINDSVVCSCVCNIYIKAFRGNGVRVL